LTLPKIELVTMTASIVIGGVATKSNDVSSSPASESNPSSVSVASAPPPSGMLMTGFPPTCVLLSKMLKPFAAAVGDSKNDAEFSGRPTTALQLGTPGEKLGITLAA
jgi:hypothetical protein